MPELVTPGENPMTHNLQPIKCHCQCHLYADKNGELLMSHVTACCCIHGYMADCLTCEMDRRTARDGIPRHITTDDNIMKMDWELVSDAVYDHDALEEHVKGLIDDAANCTDDSSD